MNPNRTLVCPLAGICLFSAFASMAAVWAEIPQLDPTSEGPWSDIERTTLVVPLVPNGSITMDGTVSQEEYGNFPGQLVDPEENAWILNFPDDRQWDDLEDSSFTFWLAHDEEFFYVGIDAKDDILNQDDDTELWKDDSVEILVDAFNDRYDVNTDSVNDPYGGHNYVSYNAKFSDWDHEADMKSGMRWSADVDWTFGEDGEVFAVGGEVDGGWHLDVRFAKSLFEDPEVGNELKDGYVMGFNIGMDDDDKFGPGENGDKSRSQDLEVQYWWANRARLIGWNADEAANYTAEQIANGEHVQDFDREINSDGRLTHGATGEIIFAPDNPFELSPGPNISVSSLKRLGQLSTETASHADVLTVRNTGTENTLTISEVIVGGADGDLFTIDGFPGTIAPQSQADIEFTFNPGGRTGDFMATFEITSDDVDAGDQTRTVEVTASVVNLQGPIAHYTLDEAEGASEMVDVSGYGRHGAYEAGGGSLALGQEALATGSALRVSDGALGRVEGRQLSFDSFTVSLWFNSDGGEEFQTLFAQGEAAGSPAYALLASGGNLTWFVGDAPVFGTEDGTAYTAGTRHHVAVSYGHEAPNKVSIFVDGVEVVSQEGLDPLVIERTAAFMIGSFNGSLPFAGILDDIQFYDRELTAEEVSWLNENPGMVIGQTDAPPPAGDGGLEGYWAFDEGTGTTAADGSEAMRNAVFRNGAPDWVDGKSGGALAFDGDDDLTVSGWKGIGGANPRTVSYWLKTDWVVDAASGTVSWGSSVNGLKWHLRLNDNAANGPVGAVRTEIQGSFHIGTKVINDDEWHHVVSLFPEGGQFMQDLIHYVDGELQEVGGTGSTTVEVNTAGEAEGGSDVTFGSRLQGADDHFFFGNLDDISIWSRALSDGEILALFNGVSPLDVAAGNIDGGGDPGDGERPFALHDVGLSASGAFSTALPGGVTADIEYSTDLIDWEVINTEVTGTFEETDAGRLGASEGYYRAK